MVAEAGILLTQNTPAFNSLLRTAILFMWLYYKGTPDQIKTSGLFHG
jgi:hypothetical protein